MPGAYIFERVGGELDKVSTPQSWVVACGAQTLE